MMGGGERAYGYAAAELAEFLSLSRELVGRAHASGELRPDFSEQDVPMIMCGVCATMGKRDAGWEWDRHLDLLIDGMRALPGA